MALLPPPPALPGSTAAAAEPRVPGLARVRARRRLRGGGGNGGKGNRQREQGAVHSGWDGARGIERRAKMGPARA